MFLDGSSGLTTLPRYYNQVLTYYQWYLRVVPNIQVLNLLCMHLLVYDTLPAFVMLLALSTSSTVLACASRIKVSQMSAALRALSSQCR